MIPRGSIPGVVLRACAGDDFPTIGYSVDAKRAAKAWRSARNATSPKQKWLTIHSRGTSTLGSPTYFLNLRNGVKLPGGGNNARWTRLQVG